jgi:hypothetical protein
MFFICRGQHAVPGPTRRVAAGRLVFATRTKACSVSGLNRTRGILTRNSNGDIRGCRDIKFGTRQRRKGVDLSKR